RRTEHDERQVVRLEGLLAEALADTEAEREHQAGDTGVDVDDRATGEVLRVPVLAEDGALVREDAAAPHPVRDRRVDEDRPQEREHEPCAELGAVRDRTRDEGGRDDGEGGTEPDADEALTVAD